MTMKKTGLGLFGRWKGDSQQTKAALKQQIECLYAANEKLRNRNEQAEQQIKNLLAEDAQVRKQSKSIDNDRDDLQDELDSAKAKVKKLTA